MILLFSDIQIYFSRLNIGQNAYCSYDIYLQWRKYYRSIILGIILKFFKSFSFSLRSCERFYPVLKEDWINWACVDESTWLIPSRLVWRRGGGRSGDELFCSICFLFPSFRAENNFTPSMLIKNQIHGTVSKRNRFLRRVGSSKEAVFS